MNRKREGDKRAEGREGERVQSVNVKQEADGAAAGARGGRHVTEAMDLDQATHCITSSYYPRCPGDTAEAEATLDAGRDVKSIRAVVRNQSAVAVGVVGYLSIAPPLQHIRGREGGLLNNAVILRLPFRASLSLAPILPSFIQADHFAHALFRLFCPPCPRPLLCLLSSLLAQRSRAQSGLRKVYQRKLRKYHIIQQTI